MFVFVLLLLVEPLVTLVVFVVLGGISIAFYRATRVRIGEYARESQRHRKLSVQAVNQGLGGFKDARILGREGFFLNSYKESTWFQAEADRYKAVIGALPRLFLETVAVAGMLSVSALLVAQDRPLESIIPTLTLLGVAIVRLMPSFQKVTVERQLAPVGRAGAQRRLRGPRGARAAGQRDPGPAGVGAARVRARGPLRGPHLPVPGPERLRPPRRVAGDR